ncbi:MAG: hypothetical protein Q8P26_04725, partial [Candidatus Levybacteria bacterium]|nr:hypothetical protein [Candidatus Levybacteria bacterium]
IGANYIAVLLNIYIVRNLKQFNNIAIKQFPKLIIILLFIPIIFKIISLYPNESVYFNPLIGGLKGAVEKNIPGWGNSLGSTYRQGAVWLNKNAEPNAKLATIYELRSNISLKDLRQDILYANSYRSSILRKGEYVMGVTHEGTNAEGFHRKYLERFLVPVHEVIIDGVSVLKIWKNDFEHTKPAYKKLENKITDFDIIKGENYLRVDLKKTIPVTRVYINYDQNNCVFPTEGYFELSFNGNIWRREGYFAVGTRTQLSEIGAFRYLFAAERTRFVRAVISDKESCLLKNPVEIEVYGM